MTLIKCTNKVYGTPCNWEWDTNSKNPSIVKCPHCCRNVARRKGIQYYKNTNKKG